MPQTQAPSILETAEALRLVIGRLGRRLRQQSLGDLTPSQRSILTTLERHGPLRMGQLASIENVSKPSISGIVDRLEEKRLVRRVPDPDDARCLRVEVTGRGREQIETARAERTAFLTTRLGRLEPDELERIYQAIPLLERIGSEE